MSNVTEETEASGAQADFPDALQPLSARLPTSGHIAALAKNTVKNVLDSYTGRFDVLAESVQNSMDALEKRWGSENEFGPELPTIQVRLDASVDEITVTDNGVGIKAADLQSALIPHMSPKSLDPKPTRGHKGVGTTFLAYGHPGFEIHTKTADSSEIAYRIDGGLAWVKGDKLEPIPEFERVQESEVLADYSSGTSVVIRVGELTSFGRLKTAQYNKLATWELVLRTFTAIGTLSIGIPERKRPAWIKNLRVELQLAGVAGAGTSIVPIGFQLPHLDASTKVSLQELQTVSQKSGVRYELLYAEYDNAALELALAAQLQELADSEAEEDQEILNAFRTYDTSVYASWTYKNTWYEDLYRQRIEEDAKRYQYNNVRSGLLVSSVGMPIGEVSDHPYSTMKPEYKRRLFIAVGFNERYSPDLGRKTIPSADRALLHWLEVQIQNMFLRHTGRLVKSNDEAPHGAGNYGEAKEQLSRQVEELRKKHDGRPPLGANLGLTRAPSHEPELVTIFGSLISSGRLPGYGLLAVPGSSTRYDALFDFRTEEFAVPTDEEPAPIGVAKSLAGSDGTLSRKGKWLEFKLRLEELVDNFSTEDGDPSKKYFDLLDLAVVWAVPSGDAIGDYDLGKFDATNWHQRNYYGATHWLSTQQGHHRVEVVAVQDLLKAL